MKKKQARWTDDEIELLKENYFELGPKEMCKLIPNHPHCSIVARARRYGLKFKNGAKPWTKKEIEILERYYPKEGTKIVNRLQNRTRNQVKSEARYRGIKNGRSQIPWPKKEDEIVCQFYLEHRGHSMEDSRLLQEILKEKGYFRGIKSIRMRLSNFQFLIDGGGLSHAAIQSKKVVKN